MAFPQSIDPGTPPGSASIGGGDDEFRALKQFICDMFGISPSPATYAGPIAMALSTGLGFIPMSFLTNKTGGALVIGDSVAVDPGNNTAVKLSNTKWSVDQFVIAMSAPADNALGLFARIGAVSAKVQGTIIRGHYVIKSTTTKALEDSGIIAAAATPTPPGTIGIAMTADSAGFATVFLGGHTLSSSGDISCRVTKAALQTITNNTVTAVVFDTERWDTFALHDTAVNNTRITPLVPGRYLIGGSVRWAANATGSRDLKIGLNGTTELAGTTAVDDGAGTHAIMQTIETDYIFNGTSDYVELLSYQNSGGNLDIEKANNVTPEFWAQLIARA